MVQEFMVNYGVGYTYLHGRLYFPARFPHAYPLWPKYSHGVHIRQLLAVNSGLISQTVSSPYSSRRIKLQHVLRHRVFYWQHTMNCKSVYMLSLCSTLQAAFAVSSRAIYNLNSSEQSILWAVSSPDSSRTRRFNLKLHYATIYW